MNTCKLQLLSLALLLTTARTEKPQQNYLRRLSGRKLAGGQTDTYCMQEAYNTASSGTLGCTANDISIVTASNIIIRDDGCQYPGDSVTFTATFQVESSARTRYDIGLWFGIDGDPNDDGALSGSCTAATPFIDGDGDVCGDILSSDPQYPVYTLTTICKRSLDGYLILPYCSSWRQPGSNEVCSSPEQAFPGSKSKCKCNKDFTVNITVPENGGGGGGVGDPHMETWYGRRYDFHGICDLVMLQSYNFMDGRGLDIHIRTAERDGTSYISTAVVQIGLDKLEIHQDGTFQWNDDADIDLPSTFGDASLNYTVVDGWLPIWDIVTPRGGRIYLQVFDTMVDVKLYGFTNEDVTDSVGLLGDFQTGFLMDRQGQWVFDTDPFGLEWQVRDTDPLLFSTIRAPQYPTACAMPDPQAIARRLENSIISEQEATKLCADAGNHRNACIMDLRLFGNPETARAYTFMNQVHVGQTL